MYSNSSKIFKSPMSPSTNSQLQLEFNADKLNDTYHMMLSRGLGKHLNCVFRNELTKYGKYLASDSKTNCNLLLPILKCYPYVLFQARIQFPWNDHEKVITFLKKYLVKNLQIMDLPSLMIWTSQDNKYGKLFWEQIAVHFGNRYLGLLDMVVNECINGSVNYTAQVIIDH